MNATTSKVMSFVRALALLALGLGDRVPEAPETLGFTRILGDDRIKNAPVFRLAHQRFLDQAAVATEGRVQITFLATAPSPEQVGEVLALVAVEGQRDADLDVVVEGRQAGRHGRWS